jgi:Transposase DDE domain
MRDLLWRVCFRRKLRTLHVTGDAKYGTIENIVAVEDAGIRAYLPLTDFEHRSALYGRDAFTYDAAADAYHGPQGHLLALARSKRTEGVVVYRGDPAICNACPVKSKCTTSDCGRTIQRSLYEHYLEKVRSYHTTEAYKKAIRKRQVWVEPMFAEARGWHGLRRLRLRGLLNANIQGLLIATGQNLKRFLAATGWGSRHAPCGSLVALPTELQGLSAVSKCQTPRSGSEQMQLAELGIVRTSRPASGVFQRPEPFDDPTRSFFSFTGERCPAVCALRSSGSARRVPSFRLPPPARPRRRARHHSRRPHRHTSPLSLTSSVAAPGRRG